MLTLAPYLKRLAISFILSIFVVALINETAHLFLKQETDRNPQTITITIPIGTSKLIAAGQFESSIPNEIAFVVGDTLKVDNLDDVPHELGPLYIPAGTSASLSIEDANKYTLGCTFQPSKYLNLDVRHRTTVSSRFKALAISAPPTTMFFFVYSILVFPIKKNKI